jgi:hypothetical protein
MPALAATSRAIARRPIEMIVLNRVPAAIALSS